MFCETTVSGLHLLPIKLTAAKQQRTKNPRIICRMEFNQIVYSVK